METTLVAEEVRCALQQMFPGAEIEVDQSDSADKASSWSYDRLNLTAAVPAASPANP